MRLPWPRPRETSRCANPPRPPHAPAARQPRRIQEQAADSAARQSMGTGHGEREWSPVGQTQFVRASRSPAQISQLRYDDADTLAALGILPRPYWPAPARPEAFPGGFVPDPPNG